MMEQQQNSRDQQTSIPVSTSLPTSASLTANTNSSSNSNRTNTAINNILMQTSTSSSEVSFSMFVLQNQNIKLMNFETL
jgi:hypothetical protein